MQRHFQTRLRPVAAIPLVPFLGLALLLVVVLLPAAPGTARTNGTAGNTAATTLKIVTPEDGTAVEIVLDDQDRIRFQNETVSHGMLVDKLQFLAGIRPVAAVLVRAGRQRRYGELVELVAAIRAAGLKNVALETVPEVIPLPDLPAP